MADPNTEGFDKRAAITRSLLGWGVVAGPFYLVVGLILALTRDGFVLSEHPLSVLMLGESGWLQQANLGVSGLMTLAAGLGLSRALRESRGARGGALVLAYGACLILSAVFKPDPMAGFPPGAVEGDPTTSGLAHLAFGGVGFLCLAAAAAVVARWFGERSQGALQRYSLASAVIVVVAFLAGAALSTSAAGVVSLWVAVVVGWLWLAVTSLRAYRSVPHPDLHRRVAT